MIRTGSLIGRRRRLVLLAWVAVVAFSLPLAARQTEHLTGGGYDVPGSESKAVSDAIQSEFAGRTDGIAVLLRAERGAGGIARAAAVERVGAAVAGTEGVRLPGATRQTAVRRLAATGTALVPLQSPRSADRLIDSAVDLRERLAPGSAEAGVTPFLVGQPTIWAGMQELSKEGLEKAEATGFPIVALILLAVFGSLAAAALPLALGFVSVIVTGALIYFISLQMETSVFVTNMASMIGIGVAIDYSLFILARYREERRAGRDPGRARAETLVTSGLAVAFSGSAVIVSLAGLWMVDNQAMRSMALGAMTVVAVAILTATTLLPALISLFGERVERPGFSGRMLVALGRRLPRRRNAPPPGTFWQRWTERVMARPWLSVLGVTAIMLILAIPVLSLETGTNAIEQFPQQSDVRVGHELAAKLTGGGADPVQVVASFGSGAAGSKRQEAIAAFGRTLAADPGIESVAPPLRSRDSVLFQARPRGQSESASSSALVNRLRERTAPASQLAAIATVRVGGETARVREVRAQIDGAFVRILGFILAFSFVVLMLMLRSLVLPLKAILMNLLSIGAAYGVLVAIFQWGWLDGLLGFESLGALDTLNVPLILAVVFGLSMDYEVFLLSRIRERYLAHGDNGSAVAEGLASSAKTISSAALIMVSVFGVFVLTGVPSIKEIGFGTAVAISLDATLVRLILVPAAMQLMGAWNWWMPAWLDRLLPELSFEGGESEPEPRIGPLAEDRI